MKTMRFSVFTAILAAAVLFAGAWAQSIAQGENVRLSGDLAGQNQVQFGFPSPDGNWVYYTTSNLLDFSSFTSYVRTLADNGLSDVAPV